ncbi:MAG: DNA repair protein RecO [Gammaproteobacteria bacterium]|jgi:DNA repair protein RecO (recombination protein O)
MASAHHFQDQAYVLHTRPYRNTSLIVDVLTREHGRLGLVAKGAKRGKAAIASRLLPYTCLYIEWGGQGELMTLFKAEADTRRQQMLPGDTLFHGFYLNELLLRLLHRHDPHPQLFDDYAHCLHALQQIPNRDVPLRYFEVQLLESLGYGMNLLVDVQSGDRVSAQHEYYYLIEQGPVRVDLQSHDALRISGDTLIALGEQQLTRDRQRNEAKQLMRAVLDYYLGDRPLKARELMQSRKLARHSTSKPG